jgi:tetratricopeptide (TPR) repeat protein
LAEALHDSGQVGRATELLRSVLDRKRQALGPDDASTLVTQVNLADALVSGDQTDEAIELFRDVLTRLESSRGPDHPETLAAGQNLAVAYQSADRPADALPLLERSAARLEAVHGPTNPDTIASLSNLAAAYRATGRTSDARALYERVLDLTRTSLGADHPYTILALNNLAHAYRSEGRLDRMLELFRESAQAIERRHFEMADAGRVLGNFVNALEYLKHPDEAELWARKWLAVARRREGPDSPALADAIQDVGGILLRRGQKAEAEPLLAEALAIREKVQPDDAPEVQELRTMLDRARRPKAADPAPP